MDPNVLQALIGNLGFGFQTAAGAREFQSSLTLPDDGTCTLITNGPEGKPRRIPVSIGKLPSGDQSHELGYYAVTLLNQQIYFGKIEITHDQRFVKLREACYVLPSNNGRRELYVLRVGQELHAPMNDMTINMTYVIMWQPLDDNGPMVQAILAGLPEHD